LPSNERLQLRARLQGTLDSDPTPLHPRDTRNISTVSSRPHSTEKLNLSNNKKLFTHKNNTYTTLHGLLKHVIVPTVISK